MRRRHFNPPVAAVAVLAAAGSAAAGAATAAAQLPEGVRAGTPAPRAEPRPKPLDVVPSRQRAVPPGSAFSAAREAAEAREGAVSFALVDTRGRLVCHRCDELHSLASVTKAMLLVAFLDAIPGREPRPGERRLLADLIRVSDNAAADELEGRLGDEALLRLARRAGMERFTVAEGWGTAQATASGVARLFHGLDELLPERHRDDARELLASVVPEQAWGPAQAGRPEWSAYSKGSWSPTGRGHLAHQAALLEGAGGTLSVAILTDANPTPRYGRETVRLVAEALLGR